MIHVSDCGPACGDVAVRAFAICRDVAGGFGRGTYQVAFRVTVGARRVGRAEGAANVATFACDVCMSAVQYETGTKVIESRLSHSIAC